MDYNKMTREEIEADLIQRVSPPPYVMGGQGRSNSEIAELAEVLLRAIIIGGILIAIGVLL